MTHTICTIVEERGGEQALYDADGEFVCKGQVFPSHYRAVKCSAVTHRYAGLDEDAWEGAPVWPELLDETWLEAL